MGDHSIPKEEIQEVKATYI